MKQILLWCEYFPGSNRSSSHVRFITPHSPFPISLSHTSGGKVRVLAPRARYPSMKQSKRPYPSSKSLMASSRSKSRSSSNRSQIRSSVTQQILGAQAQDTSGGYSLKNTHVTTRSKERGPQSAYRFHSRHPSFLAQGTCWR